MKLRAGRWWRWWRWVGAGALSCSLLLPIILHTHAGLQWYCLHDCLLQMLDAPLSPLDKDVILHIRHRWLDPPAPRGTFDPSRTQNPSYRTSRANWLKITSHINNFFTGRKVPGTFVEVGAGDGEFKSLTVFVEQQLGFRGLLVEPNPELYPRLRAAGRGSHTINACASPQPVHKRGTLWIRDIPPDTPSLLPTILRGYSSLLQFVSHKDRHLGHTVSVQCFSVGAMAVAALRTLRIDLVALHINEGEVDVLYTIPDIIKITMLVVVRAITTQNEINSLNAAAAHLGLQPLVMQLDYHIFISQKFNVSFTNT